MEIRKTMREIHSNAKQKGFYDGPVNIAEKLMLIVSETAEACEADRKGKYTKNRLETDKHIVSDTPDWDTFIMQFETYVKDTFEDELADTVIRIFDLCEYLNIDLEWHIRQKMKYNSKREYMHGKKY